MLRQQSYSTNVDVGDARLSASLFVVAIRKNRGTRWRLGISDNSRMGVDLICFDDASSFIPSSYKLWQPASQECAGLCACPL